MGYTIVILVPAVAALLVLGDLLPLVQSSHYYTTTNRRSHSSLAYVIAPRHVPAKRHQSALARYCSDTEDKKMRLVTYFSALEGCQQDLLERTYIGPSNVIFTKRIEPRYTYMGGEHSTTGGSVH